MTYPERIRMDPRSGDRFTAEQAGARFILEVDFLSGPWVFYKKSLPGDVRASKLKVSLANWSLCLARAKIKKVKP